MWPYDHAAFTVWDLLCRLACTSFKKNLLNSQNSYRNLIHSKVRFTVRNRLVCTVDKSTIGACCYIGSSRTKVIRHLCVEFIRSLWLRTSGIASTSSTSTSTSITGSRALGRRFGGSSRFWVTLWVSSCGQRHTIAEGFELTQFVRSGLWQELKGGLGQHQGRPRSGMVSEFPPFNFEVMKTFIGRLSTSRPLSLRRASFALEALLNMIVATPRLTPLGPYVIIARLTGPTDLPKYSYIRRMSTELVHWHAALKKSLHGIASEQATATDSGETSLAARQRNNPQLGTAAIPLAYRTQHE